MRGDERRTVLLDAAIGLLARDGARGLTYRALDSAAGTPPGTASNYFRTREVMLGEVGRRVYERLRPSPDWVERERRARPSRKRIVELMQALMRRVEAEGEAYLAFVELRLESTRYPALAVLLAETLRADFADNLAFHQSAKLPGGAPEVALLTVAINGLIIERLTMRDVVPIGDLDTFVRRLVERLVPARPRSTLVRGSSASRVHL